MERVELIRKRMAKVLQIIIAAIILSLLTINSVQVLLRYILKWGFIWANDYQVYCLYVIVSLAIPYLWLEKKHVYMDYADKIFPTKVLRMLDYVCDFWGGVVSILMIVSASRAFVANKGMVATVIGYDESLVYVPFIVGGVLWCVSVIISLIKRFGEDMKNGN